MSNEQARDGSSRRITLQDILFGGNEFVRNHRPVSPDMDRITEIVLGMKAITSEHKHDQQAFMDHWRDHIEKLVDFDALMWQAFQVACDLQNVRTGADMLEVRRNPSRNALFVATCQAFYDGFLLGSEFQAKGGHRD